MKAVHFDTRLEDPLRRRQLYDGDLFVYSPTASSIAFCEFAQSLIRDAFGTLDPETAQDHLDVDDYIEILKSLKPEFIHHPESKRHIRQILSDLQCDLEDIYFDVPRLRSSTSDGYLTTGIAYAWHPHRDVWYSAPKAQINIWIPVFDIQKANTVAFYPSYFDEFVPNDSERYNYYEWNLKHRGAAASQRGKDTRPLPGPDGDIETRSAISVVCPAGGLVLFSGAQLHASVPNSSGLTRFSIDFRTVSISDILADNGAVGSDAACTGSSIRDFVRTSDFSEMPDHVVDKLSDGTETQGVVSFDQPG